MSMFTETADSLTRAVVVTPSDTAPIAFAGANPPSYARRLWYGASSTVTITVVTLGGDTVAYTLSQPGYIRMKCTQVKATGTTAPANTIVAEY